MAPKTPQSNSKLPKAPSAAGPVPLTGIPAPASVLQRRSFMPTPGGPSKTFKDMTPEQQALLAEAISMHSPGLIDPTRKPTTSTSTASPSASGAGMVAAAAGGAAQGFSSLQNHYPTSPGNSTSSSPTPTGLSSPLSFRPNTQIGRRPSQTKLGMIDPAQAPITNATTTNQFTRPSSYSGITPLSTSASNLPQAGSVPSPTALAGPGGTRTTAGSPSGSRPALTPSRLSAGAAPRSSMMKQPLFQRPGPTTPTSAIGGAIGVPGPGLVNPSPAKANSLSAIPGSPALAPPSLDNYEIGDRVIVESMALTGYLRYLGPAEFKSGTWAGIELDTPTGKNDGSVNGVVYFSCRPKCGIFVLAAKIVKSELLFPTSPDLNIARPPSVEEDIPTPLPQVNHAAQAASRITAGSRASKYIGMTASQLKQRNGTPMSSAAPSRSTSISIPSQAPGNGIRAASPTIRALGGKTGSPTTPRTLTAGAANNRSGSPSPTQGPKQPLRANSPTTRTTLTARLSQTGPKPTLASLATKTGAHSRSTSSTSSVTSQSSANGARARTSPTPTRSLTAPRRLSSRSDTPEGNILSPSESRANLLDQASAIQMVSSPSDNVSLQLQQLQLDFDVAMAQNSLLKSEVHDTKTQLEKALGREGSDGRLSQELEDLHLMKIVWEKEKAAKDQEIQVMTEKMTQAWLEAARSQKERTALMQEKADLANRLQNLQENGSVGPTEAAEQQSLIEILKLNLQEADQKTLELEHKLQDLNARAIEEEERMARVAEEYKSESEARFQDQLEKITSDREALEEQLTALEVSSRATKDDLESQLEAALYKAEETRTHLVAVQHQLEDDAQTRVAAEYKTKEKFLKAEHDLSESQALLAKSEKYARNLEEKAKELEASIAKRDQEITGLKSEMEEVANMVQSEEVDRMRKVWEHEKKRLEEAVADNITVMTTLRSDIQAMETTEEELLEQIKEAEEKADTLTEAVSAAKGETAATTKALEEAKEQFTKERAELEAKIQESESAWESRLGETKERMEELEEIALTVEDWKERCEAMQLEMIQKTAMVEDIGFKLAEAQEQQDALEKTLAERNAEPTVDLSADLEKSLVDLNTLKTERDQLLVKVSELEAALALSASTKAVPTESAPSEVVLNRAELEEEISHLKQMVHDLTRENVTVASVNKKLMQEHDNLMEAHKHVETECLKLMDEVERLHSESLAVGGMEVGEVEDKDELDVMHHNAGAKGMLTSPEELKAALNNVTVITKDTPAEKEGTKPSASVVRLESLLKEKEALLDRLMSNHAAEMKDLRLRYVELDRNKSWEITQLNKELTELESLIESKIFHEADLEEDVQKKQTQIDRLQREISDLKAQLAKGSNGSVELPSSGLSHDRPSYTGSAPASGVNGYTSPDYSRKAPVPGRTRTTTQNTDQPLFCEICEEEGHDLISCVAVFGAGKTAAAHVSHSSHSSTPVPSGFNADLEDNRPYCENCEEY
ncbi:CAP-Gly domain-containing linker protein 4 [Podila horticola]|nr:CAP-Gly domain-containing linker protein 4 [Podila horticola]